MAVVPPPPAVAHRVFGSALPAATRYAELLAGPGVERGLIGPREVPRLWERHLLNCAVVAPVVAGPRLIDLGSGAGLPGIVLALLRPELEVTLIDATRRRTDFLAEVVAELGLSRVSVRWVRVEADGSDGLAGLSAETVVARAVAPLDRLVAWALPLVRVGGELLALKGVTAAEEVAMAEYAVRAAGGGDVRVETLGVGMVEPPTVVVRVRRVAARPLRRPTRTPGRRRG